MITWTFLLSCCVNSYKILDIAQNHNFLHSLKRNMKLEKLKCIENEY